MTPIFVDWNTIKTFCTDRAVSIQWVEAADHYRLRAYDNMLCLDATLAKDGGADVTEFESDFKTAGNGEMRSAVATKVERDDITVKLARYTAEISSGEATIVVRVPDSGRYLSGGWGILDSYDPDDYVLVDIWDDDRLIATSLGGLTDEQMQTMTPYTEYPKVGAYTDEELPADNQGWYFWPVVRHDGTSGEVEFEPLGWYANVMGGLYIKMRVFRPNVSDGVIRACMFWGQKRND